MYMYFTMDSLDLVSVSTINFRLFLHLGHTGCAIALGISVTDFDLGVLLQQFVA